MLDYSFDDFIRLWARLTLILLVVQAYLTINKIWIRKHEPEVALSVSVSAQLLAMFASLPFVALYTLEGAYEGAIGEVLYILVSAVMVMIGAGLWVGDRRGRGFLRNIGASLRLERNEATTLLHEVFRPVGARSVVAILCELALIDDDLDVRELELIRTFATRWGVNLDNELAQRRALPDGDIQRITRLRNMVEEYLSLSPPVDQVGQLHDLLKALTQADDRMSAEEALVMDELSGLIGEYATGGQGTQYNVLIAPQNLEQEQALAALLPQIAKEPRLGGEVFVVGRYFSQNYAETICSWYRKAGFLTVTEQYTEPGKSRA